MPERSIQELENLFKNYNSNSKWNFFNKKIANSYFLQLKTIAKLFNKTTENISILELGIGSGICAVNLKNLGFSVTTFDGQKENNPDIIGDIKDFCGKDYVNKFDLICSFQTLEHIPYIDSLKVLQEFKKAKPKYIFFSVPHHIKTFKLSLELPKIKKTKNSFFNKLIWRWNYGFSLTLKFKFRKAKNRVYKKGVHEKFPYAIHHWELGRNKLSISHFIKDLKKLGFTIKSHFPNEEYHYHHFFLLETV